MRRIVIALIAALVSGSAYADDPRADHAKACTRAVLRELALRTSEPADAVAHAAFDKCEDEWRRVVHQVVEENGGGYELYASTFDGVRRKVMLHAIADVAILRATPK